MRDAARNLRVTRTPARNDRTKRHRRFTSKPRVATQPRTLGCMARSFWISEPRRGSTSSVAEVDVSWNPFRVPNYAQGGGTPSRGERNTATPGAVVKPLRGIKRRGPCWFGSSAVQQIKPRFGPAKSLNRSDIMPGDWRAGGLCFGRVGLPWDRYGDAVHMPDDRWRVPATLPTYVDATNGRCVHNSGLSTHNPKTHKGCVHNRSYVRSGWSDQST